MDNKIKYDAFLEFKLYFKNNSLNVSQFHFKVVFIIYLAHFHIFNVSQKHV